MASYRTKFLGLAASAIVAPNSIEPQSPGGLLEPLISEDQKDELECRDDNPWSGLGVIIGIFILGAAGITVSAAAMVSETGAVVVYLAGGLCILNSAILVKNQYQISNGKTPAGYRHGINSLRKEATKFGGEYELLIQAVDELQREAHSKKQFEDRLSDIARRKNTKVNDIVMLVNENEEILSQQKAILKQIFLVDIAKAFFTSEFHTEDMKVDMEYLPILILRLRMQLDSHGMRLDTDKLTNIIRQNNDVYSLLKIFGSMLLLETAGNFDTDDMGVVTLHEKYSRGSVDLARGKTPRLIETKNKQRDTFARDVKVWLNINGIMVSSPKKSNVSARDSTGASYGYDPVKALRGIKSKDIEAKAKAASSSLGLQQMDGDYVIPAKQKSQVKTQFNTSALMTVNASLRGPRIKADGSINKPISPHKGSVREDRSVAQVSSSGKTSLLRSSQFILSHDDFSQSTGVSSRNSTESDESSSSSNSTGSVDNSSSANSAGSTGNSSSRNEAPLLLPSLSSDVVSATSTRTTDNAVEEVSSFMGMQKRAQQRSQIKTNYDTALMTTASPKDFSTREQRSIVKSIRQDWKQSDVAIHGSVAQAPNQVEDSPAIPSKGLIEKGMNETSLIRSSQFILSHDDFSQSTGVSSANSTGSAESSSSTNSTGSDDDSTSEKSTGTAGKLISSGANNSSSANSTGSADNSSSANSTRSADSSSRKSAAALVRLSKLILSHDDSSQSESSDVSNASSTRIANINSEKHRGSETVGRTSALQQKNKSGD